MYRLKEEISHPAFLQKVKACRGSVTFVSAEGDMLNLKSALSQFMFAACFTRPEIVCNAEIRLTEQADYEALKEFLLETEG